ncbi:DsrH/TusB family sulfur relay protein [Methanothrix soehngenii]|uniref:DsrH/TusB family sulfur relay protein n=1 Tax=Methanothrix soehngenii TaxID=2223 RepID=UPI002C7F5649|nr:DsrH/TusB family sulfur metabolism protein [Methanothrix soehngenii]HOS22424.1 DsrH/TusB family sulfur metabolism protein [Methanothrix soehngenii]HPL20792.1 DsrH/TusB family sulfur metabolism protein [Methanothrix soehngenii]
MATKDIFLLTRPPHSERTALCLRLMGRCGDPVLYLAGDGVYNLLDEALMGEWPGRIMACKEDLEARGVQAGEGVAVPEDFYQLLVEEMMAEGSRIYSF